VNKADKKEASFKRAMVLAAGFGTRLRPLTLDVPKPLIEVCGTPLILHALGHLARAGIADVMINTHHLGAAIGDALGSTHRGMTLHFSHEETILGTGGGLANVAPFFKETHEPFLLLNADALIDLDVEALTRAHLRHRPLATLVLKKVSNPHRFGALGTDADDVIHTFAGRVAYAGPPLHERMFCGVHAIEPALFEHLPPRGESCINKEGYPRAMGQGESLRAVDHPGYFCDVGTPERLLEANLSALTGSVQLTHLDLKQDLGELRPENLDPEDSWQRTWVSTDATLDASATLRPPLIVGRQARIEAKAVVGPGAIIGPGATVGQGASVQGSVLHSGARLGPGEECFGRVVAKSCQLKPDWDQVLADNPELARLAKAS
jgi:NDP-sugar pyrophosphorylase family protein